MWFYNNKLAFIGAIIISIIAVVSLFAPVFAPTDPTEIQIKDKLCQPSKTHWLGCDHEGVNVLSKMIYGGRVSLYVSIITVFFSLILGGLIGLISGYWGGKLDLFFMRICDIFLAFPGILLAIAIAGMLGPSVHNTIIALVITGWVGFARLIRGEVLYVKEREYVSSAHAIGASNLYIIFVYILPCIIAPIVVQTTFALAGVIIAESSLSFLGLGTPIDTPSWGKMLDDGRGFLFEAPRLTIIPGLGIMTLVMGFNFIGDALRDYFDPKSRKHN